ncbi:MAG TPA: iron-containing alcohol dehydrogenase family protein [Natronosporangium sp.]
MPLLARTLLAPLTIEIRPGVLGNLAEVLSDRRISAGGDVAVVVGPGLGEEVAAAVRPQLRRCDIITITGGTVDAALELGGKLRARPYDAVVGIGGGKTIDTVKYAASQHGVPMVTVATSLAHDGIASPVSTLQRDGVSVSYGVHTPYAVLVDLDYVRRSPSRMTRSGIGDALSNLSATADWELAHDARGEPIDGLALALSRTGAEAVLSHGGDATDQAFLATLANALVLGGVAMAVAGTSLPCSGGCHEIGHAITELYPGTGSHGEQVGLGALFCTFLRGAPIRQLRDTLRRHGLPVTPTELGLEPDQFARAVQRAPQTRPGRYTILEHLDLPYSKIRAAVDEFTEAAGAED